MSSQVSLKPPIAFNPPSFLKPRKRQKLFVHHFNKLQKCTLESNNKRLEFITQPDIYNGTEMIDVSSSNEIIYETSHLNNLKNMSNDTKNTCKCDTDTTKEKKKE